MDQVRVFLRTNLFTTGTKDGHVPHHTLILDGRIKETVQGGIWLVAEAYADGSGKPLLGTGCTIFLPYDKIDHLLRAEEGR